MRSRIAGFVPQIREDDTAMSMGSHPRYIEALRVGGGYGDPADGGADLAPDGAITTDGPIHTEGDVSLRGRLSAGATPTPVTNGEGELLGDRLEDGSVGRDAIALGAVGPEQIDASARFSVDGLQVVDTLEAGGDASLARVAATGPFEVYDPDSLGAEEIANGDFESGWTDETQFIDLNSSTSGYWRLAFQGQETVDLIHNAPAAELKAALEALSAIDQVSVTGGPGGPYTVVFDGPTLAARTQPLVTVAESTLSGGAGPVGVTRVVHGGRADGWAVSDSTPSVIALRRETADVYSGAAAQRLTRTNAGAYNARIFQPAMGLVPGRWYRLRMAIKVISGSLPTVQVRGATWQTLLSDVANRDWVEYTCDFRLKALPSSGIYELWLFTNYYAAVDLILDSVSLRPIDAGEIAAAADVTAGGDLRVAGDGAFGGTVSAASFVDNSPYYAGGDALGLLRAIRAQSAADADGFAEVDHASLGPLRSTREIQAYRDRVTGVVVHASEARAAHASRATGRSFDAWARDRYESVTLYAEHRDLGRQVQVNTAAILELCERLDRLESCTGDA